WQLCSTTSPKLVHLQEKLCVNAVVPPRSMRDKGLIDPLRRRPFRRLVTSYAVNELGDWMAIIALSVLIFERTDSALATAGLFLGTSFLPAMAAPVLGTPGGRAPPPL